MKTVVIPEPITLTFPDGARTFGFADFVVDTLLNVDPRFGEGRAALKAADRIETAVRGAAPGSACQLDEADWTLLKAVAESPKTPYNPGVARKLMAFLDAIAEAT